MRRLDLVAARGSETHGKKRLLDLSQQAFVETGRRQIVAMGGEDAIERSLDRGRQRLIRGGLSGRLAEVRFGEFRFEDVGPDRFLRVEGGEAANEIF